MTRQEIISEAITRATAGQSKQLAVMVECAGIQNEGRAAHSMRDYCSSCAPFWEEYPTCPNDGRKLSKTGYCAICHKHYEIPAKVLS